MTEEANTEQPKEAQAEAQAMPEAANDAEPLPTVADAQAMFHERADLAGVLTDQGWLRRDGVVVPAVTAA